MGFVSNIRGNMLFYSVLQSLGGASYVARITLAHKFIIIITNILNLKRLYTRQWSKTRPFLTFLIIFDFAAIFLKLTSGS